MIKKLQMFGIKGYNLLLEIVKRGENLTTLKDESFLVLLHPWFFVQHIRQISMMMMTSTYFFSTQLLFHSYYIAFTSPISFHYSSKDSKFIWQGKRTFPL